MNKKDKFHRSDFGDFVVRYEFFPSKKIIAFGITGLYLSVLQLGPAIDFDKESDEIIKENLTSNENMAFEYYPNIGFERVNPKEQSWFIFSS